MEEPGRVACVWARRGVGVGIARDGIGIVICSGDRDGVEEGYEVE